MKNKTTRLSLAFLIFVTAFLIPPAFAQVPTGRHTVTGFLGSQLFDVGDQFDSFGDNLKTELNFGGRYQYNVNERWGLEGNFLFSPGNTELLRAGITNVNVDAFYYTGGVVFNILTHSSFTPYLTAGAGAVTLDVGNRGNNETKFAGSFGGGLLYGLGHGLSARFDLRDFVYNADGLGDNSVQALQLPKNFDETINDISVTGGLSFTF